MIPKTNYQLIEVGSDFPFSVPNPLWGTSAEISSEFWDPWDLYPSPTIHIWPKISTGPSAISLSNLQGLAKDQKERVKEGASYCHPQYPSYRWNIEVTLSRLKYSSTQVQIHGAGFQIIWHRQYRLRLTHLRRQLEMQRAARRLTRMLLGKQWN